MCHVYVDSVASLQKAFGPHADEIMGELPKRLGLNSEKPL